MELRRKPRRHRRRNRARLPRQGAHRDRGETGRLARHRRRQGVRTPAAQTDPREIPASRRHRRGIRRGEPDRRVRLDPRPDRRHEILHRPQAVASCSTASFFGVLHRGRRRRWLGVIDQPGAPRERASSATGGRRCSTADRRVSGNAGFARRRRAPAHDRSRQRPESTTAKPDSAGWRTPAAFSAPGATATAT